MTFIFPSHTPWIGLVFLFPGGRESALACAGGDQGLDPTSQFEQDHRQARLRHRECRKRRRGEATALQQAAAPAKKRRSARRSPMERALVQAVAEDFRARVAVGSYFSVPSSCVWSSTRQESLPMFAKAARPATTSADELGPDCEELRPVAAAAEGGYRRSSVGS